jgi:hypothetical protein
MPRDPGDQPVLAMLAVVITLLVWVLFVYADLGKPLMELAR